MCRITQSISGTLWVTFPASKRKCIFNCVPWFLKLSNKVDKYLSIWLICLSVRPSVHALTTVNVLQMFKNLYMLFISDIEWSVLKMSFMWLKVRLQGHTKIFRCITAYGKKIFKAYCNKFTFH